MLAKANPFSRFSVIDALKYFFRFFKTELERSGVAFVIERVKHICNSNFIMIGTISVQ